MHDHNDHAELMAGFFEEQQHIFDTSNQAMYAFLDDDSRVCNRKFAALLGYASPEEWAQADTPNGFPDAFVAPKSQQTLVDAYQNAMEKCVASTVKISWKKKSGDTIESSVTLVPVAYQGHLFALHFLS